MSVGEVGAELEQSSRVDAFVVYPWGGALRGDGDVEGFLDRLLVGGQMSGREVEPAADLVVAGHASVGREECGDVEAGKGEEVLERILEFLAGEPA